MKKLCLEHEGILYRNQRPGYRAQCAFLPNVVSLSDKELLCLYRLGQAFYSIDGNFRQAKPCEIAGRVHDMQLVVYAGVYNTRKICQITD